MSYTVYFWTGFAKKNNSTLTPTTGRTQFDCIIKDGSGILNPEIQLDLGLAADPSQFNYCQIPDFERYYYVNEWYFERGLWTATLTVDVLATYKTQIGASTLYVLRAAAAYDGTVVDNLYPTKVGCTFDHSTVTSPYLLTGGTYVLGCISPDGDYGSITYTALTGGGLSTLCSYLINDAISESNGFSLSDASLRLQTSIIDPLSYIKTCMYFPFALQDFDLQTVATTFKIFSWQIPQVLNARINNERIVKNQTFNIIKHPDTTARGNYVNSAPYTMLTLYCAPFGVIEIDTSVTANQSSLTAEFTVDPISGRGTLRILCNGTVLHSLKAQIGVPIQLSQITRDYVGGITSMVSGIAGTIGSALTGNVAGAISSAASGIGNAINAMKPRQQSMGTGGGFDDIQPVTWTLDHQFFRPVTDDPSHNGRPLCQLRQLSTLAGYQMIQDGDVPIPGTSEEADKVRGYLESGYYYE